MGLIIVHSCVRQSQAAVACAAELQHRSDNDRRSTPRFPKWHDTLRVSKPYADAQPVPHVPVRMAGAVGAALLGLRCQQYCILRERTGN
jgi:hypothetical protein